MHSSLPYRTQSARPSARPFAGKTGWSALLFVFAVAVVLALPSGMLAQQTVPIRTPEKPTPTPILLISGKKPAVVPGTLIIPSSSQVIAADLGRRAHTNVRYIAPATASPAEAPPYSDYGYETPESLACIYRLVTQISGCNPNSTVNVPAGGSQTIAIVDAYDDPEAAPDLAYFSAQFGLSFNPSKFNVVYATGSAPSLDPTGGWELEEALDIEYAHAMAPNATLYLVEANSSSYADLFTAVIVASRLVQCGKTTVCPTGSTGKGEVTMSWGGEEFSTEAAYDAYLKAANVVYFAAAGDSPGVIYPCVSPNVICAGGTTTARSLATGNLIQEIAWSDAGGGISSYESLPSYQASISSIAGKFRGVPDLASDANPNTGAWVYDSFPMDSAYEGNWWIVGGTSLASPTLAGIVNAAGHFAASSVSELATIYANRALAADFNDITYGACGYYSNSFSTAGWDACTGVGSPNGLIGK